MQGKLYLIRHGESEWNALGQWTGLTDVKLTDKGRADAEKLGTTLQGIMFNHAYTSKLKRTQETLEHVLKGHGQTDLSRSHHEHINERDYGALTGKNKWQVKEELGDDAFTGIRRSWDHPVPEGETLKDVYDRALPFYLQEIMPRVQSGEHIMVVSHGNTIRALMKYLEDISDEDIAQVEMNFGTVLIYDIDGHGRATNKEVRSIDVAPSHA